MYIAIDIGGTNIRLAGSFGLEKPSFVGRPIRKRNSGDYTVDIQYIADSAREIGGEDIEAIGVSMVGTLDKSKTGLVSAKNLAHWSGKSFVKALSRLLGCPVYAEGDTVAGALAEVYYAHEPGSFAYVIWGTGIGGALVGDDGRT